MTEPRFNKIDDAIQRLAIVAGDMSRMLAVHEEKLINQAKVSDDLKDKHDFVLEKIEERRIDQERKISEAVFANNEKHKNLVEEFEENFEKLQNKIADLQKNQWIAYGACSIIGFAITVIIEYMRATH